MLYESYIHPITILSSLPSAGVGALLVLMLFRYDLSVIALIGIILLIGIVKKNAIMMIDFALEAERSEGKSPLRRDSRGLPAALPADHDDDHVAPCSADCRWRSATAPARNCAARSASPSSAACWCRKSLTLYTTPVIYLYLDRAAAKLGSLRRRKPRAAGLPETAPGAPAFPDA